MVFFQEIYRKVVAMGGKRRTGYSTELPGANVYTVPCPIIHALNLIGGKWKLPVLWHLFDAESVRYNELKRSVVGITNIMLTQCLRELEAAGLVRRNDFGEVPPRVEYSLTGAGRELLPPARTLQMGREAACPHRRGRSAFLLSRFAAFSRIASRFIWAILFHASFPVPNPSSCKESPGRSGRASCPGLTPASKSLRRWRGSVWQ